MLRRAVGRVRHMNATFLPGMCSWTVAARECLPRWRDARPWAMRCTEHTVGNGAALRPARKVNAEGTTYPDASDTSLP
jgi:hypothetical protein